MVPVRLCSRPGTDPASSPQPLEPLQNCFPGTAEHVMAALGDGVAPDAPLRDAPTGTLKRGATDDDRCLAANKQLTPIGDR